MKTKEFFVKENEAIEAKKGRFGKYANYFGNRSEKNMAKLGFSLMRLTDEQLCNINALKTKQLAKEHEAKMLERAKDLSNTMSCKPIKLGKSNHLWESVANIGDTQMADYYRGCGKGTVYIENGCIIGFHYGYEKPINAPKCESVSVEFSCYQILF